MTFTPEELAANLDNPIWRLSNLYKIIIKDESDDGDDGLVVQFKPNRAQRRLICVLESAAYSWDDEDPENISNVVRKSNKACEVLGIEPTPHNARRIAGIVIDGLPDLIRMPTAAEKELRNAAIGRMQLRADGQAIAEQDIRLEKETGAEYA